MGRFLALIALLAAASWAPAHELDYPEGPQVIVNVWVRNDGVVDLWSGRPSEISEADTIAAFEGLGCAFEKSGSISEDGITDIWGECFGAFDRSELLVEGQLNLAPLSGLAGNVGAPLRIDLGHSYVAHSETSEDWGSFHEDWGHGYYNGYFPDANPPEGIALTFGYRTQDLYSIAAAILLTIFGPLPFVVWLRRRSLARKRAGDERAWLGFALPLNFVILFFWAAWWAAVAIWQIGYLPHFALDKPYFGSPLWDFVRNAGWAWAPAIGSVLAARASTEAVCELTGKTWTRAELTKMTAGALAALLIPALLVFTGLNAVSSGNYSAAAGLIIAAILSLFLAMGMLQRYQGFTPVAVTSGELRDRVFELAKQASVDLRQLFIIPDGRHKATNALAVGSRVVMLTESLVRGLSRAELDSVVGHELSHLQKKHAWYQIPLIVVPLAVLGVATDLMAPHMIPVWSYGFILATVVTLSLGLVSRSHERVADTGGVEISGNPEAFITGMVKLARLNSLPLDWGSGGILLTHPSMQQRIDAVATGAGIREERLSELVENPPDAVDTYELPGIQAAEQSRVFSQNARNLAAIRKTFVGLGGIVLIPATLLTIEQQLGWSGTTSMFWLGASIVISCLGIILLDRWEAPLGAGAMAAQVRENLAEEGFPADDAIIVGFGPHDEPRVYDNSQVWDIGGVFLLEDRLVYIGEETRFALRRDEIASIDIKSHRPRLRPESVVVIRWSGGALRLQRFEPRPLGKTFETSNELTRRIEAWKSGNTASEAADVFADLPLPEIGDVTSDPCSKLYNAKTLLVSLVFAAALGTAAAFMLGFSFGGADALGWRQVLLTCSASVAAYWNDRPFGQKT